MDIQTLSQAMMIVPMPLIGLIFTGTSIIGSQPQSPVMRQLVETHILDSHLAHARLLIWTLLAAMLLTALLVSVDVLNRGWLSTFFQAVAAGCFVSGIFWTARWGIWTIKLIDYSVTKANSKSARHK